jgi:hypothetical protein
MTSCARDNLELEKSKTRRSLDVGRSDNKFHMRVAYSLSAKIAALEAGNSRRTLTYLDPESERGGTQWR